MSSPTFTDAVAQLTTDHPTTVGGLTGTEPALLDLLRQAITSPATTVVTSLQAQYLWNGIALVVAEYWPYAGLLQHASTPLPARLQEWARSSAGSANEPLLMDLCTGWATQIRELVGPVLVPLRPGDACLSCHATHWMTGWDGVPVFLPAVVFSQAVTPLQAGCMACGDSWSGDALLRQA